MTLHYHRHGDDSGSVFDVSDDWTPPMSDTGYTPPEVPIAPAATGPWFESNLLVTNRINPLDGDDGTLLDQMEDRAAAGLLHDTSRAAEYYVQERSAGLASEFVVVEGTTNQDWTPRPSSLSYRRPIPAGSGDGGGGELPPGPPDDGLASVGPTQAPSSLESAPSDPTESGEYYAYLLRTGQPWPSDADADVVTTSAEMTLDDPGAADDGAGAPTTLHPRINGGTPNMLSGEEHARLMDFVQPMDETPNASRSTPQSAAEQDVAVPLKPRTEPVGGKENVFLAGVGGFFRGGLQGVLNVANAVTDVGVEVVNLAGQTRNLVQNASIELDNLATGRHQAGVAYRPLEWEWSAGLVKDRNGIAVEDAQTHALSRGSATVGVNAALLALGLKGTQVGVLFQAGGTAVTTNGFLIPVAGGVTVTSAGAAGVGAISVGSLNMGHSLHNLNAEAAGDMTGGANGGNRAPNTGGTSRPTYDPSSKHGTTARGTSKGVSSPAPTNGQAALDNSIQVKPTSPRRVGVDPTTGEIVVFDETTPGVFHGHVPGWENLHPDMQRALIKAGQVTQKGKVK
jgi:hypothetical protein